ncbi:hypothetical protein F8388_025271 [Cannabis sativa]|uniref:Steroid 5-alpha reductase C-terminal domain-containing protein n=1 Tax=Cannabis sativa TaxID=3483 RepID=A0A7J6FSN2_CANSA|nr:hypothetical protein F8388_025271 [Cannabis sativa]
MGTVIDSHFLGLTAIVTVGYQLLFFIVTALLKIDKVTDFAGSTNFIILAVLTLVVKGSWHFRQVVLSCLVVVWGLRLGLFLLLRILQWGEDRRFDEMRQNLGKLAVFWIFQAVWVWTVSLPVTVVNASNREPSFEAADIIGWIIWLIGFLIEASADQQKLQFKNAPENRGKWCNVGLWKYTRHPNYFGEASSDKKFGNVAGYATYKKTTSPLIPLPPQVYGNLPSWFKKIFLFELPLYNRNFPQEGQN